MSARPSGDPWPVAVTRALVLALIVAVPLTIAPGTSLTRSFPRYALVVAGALAALLTVAAGALLRCRGLVPNRLFWPVLVLVAWSAVSAVASDDRGTAVFGFAGSYNGLLTTASLSVLFLAAAALPPADARRIVLALWFGAGGGVILYGVVQLTERLVDPPGAGWDLVPPVTAPWSISATLGNPNHLAGFAAMVLPLGAVLWALSGSRRERAVIGAMAAVLVVELVATGSRGGWLATLVAAATLAVLFRDRLAPFRRRVAPTAAILVGALLATAVLLGAVGVAKRGLASTASVGRGSTVDLRVQLWRTAWRVVDNHPVVGVGPDGFAGAFPAHVTEEFVARFGAFSVATDAHNLFATTAATRGLPGLAALLVLVAAAGRLIVDAWRRLATAGGATDGGVGSARLLLGGVSAGLAGYLVQASFNTAPVSLSFVAWMLLAAVCILASVPIPPVDAGPAGPGGGAAQEAVDRPAGSAPERRGEGAVVGARP